VAVITEEQYRLLKTQADIKLGKKKVKPSEDHRPDLTPEFKLMGKIMAFCKTEGYPCQCFRPSRKAIGFITPGWPD